ncbi:MAG TPA: ferritin [bacterium]|nr:ferritin [bacterium]
MLSKKMQKALCDQVTAEHYSAYLYLGMSAYFNSIDLPGFANWMYIQAQEELVHGIAIYHQIHERNGEVTLNTIEAPPKKWKSPVDVFENTCSHEQKVTASINNLVNLAIEEKDHATNNFLQWYVKEQVEEEATAYAILQKLKMMKDAPGGIFMMDKELGARVFTMPSIMAASAD